MVVTDENKYWFPAKTYGWGWGLPTRWQGWAVLAVYAVFVISGFLVFPPKADAPAFLIYMSVISSLLVAICCIKGEPPKWRWGKKR